MASAKTLTVSSLVQRARERAADVVEAARRGSGVAEAVILLVKSIRELVEVVRGGAR